MRNILALAAASGILLGCTPSGRIVTYVAATIPVVNETLSLSPITSEGRIEHLPGWPRDPDEQKLLLKTFDEIWFRLQAEFRKCQKYGYYSMVSDDEDPTMRISVAITSVELVSDTLKMPIRLQAERLRDDQRFLYTLPAVASVPPMDRSTRPLHYYGNLLADYSRRFPYRVLVSFFYHHKLEENRPLRR